MSRRAGWLLAVALASLVGCRGETELVTSLATTGTGAGGSGGVGGSSGGGEAGAPPSGPPTLMAWNLETYPLSSTTEERVVQVLADFAPDVVSVEEISDAAAFDVLDGALETYTALLNDDPGAFQRVGILYRQGRVTISEAETLFKTNSYAFPRPPLKVRVQIGRLDYLLVVLHLKAQLDAESQARRRAACQVLDNWMRAQVMNGNEIVLAGDMNDEITDAPQYNVFQVFLDDPAFYTFLTMPEAESGEYSYIPFTSLIDHVLVTNGLLDEYGAGPTEVLHLDESIPDYRDTVSDHRPVRTVFEAVP
jgi:endonuclease/exonuclease/phosphatase family metal-dependent hydrolase